MIPGRLPDIRTPYIIAVRNVVPITLVSVMAKAISSSLLALTLLLSGAVFAQDDAAEAEAVEETGEDLAFDREGEQCISTRAIRETQIIDDRTILFRMRGGVVYVNNLTNNCRGLRRERRFSYSPTAGRLCNVDTIRVIEDFGGVIQEGIACGLGSFYPITEEESELLKVEASERRSSRPQMRVENPNAYDENEESD